MSDTRTIDGFGPLPVDRPTSAAELGDIVRRAVTEDKAIYPVGGGTLLHLGRVPTRPGVAVELSGLNQVIDYPARDLTITVQAGIPVARLQETLAAERQWLPIDVPHADRATLGGAIAANVSGPRRYGYGTFRDYVIGISFVTDAGTEVKAGGRVVKNVAGYDLCKLQVGAMGTLGIIAQVTLKVRPLPEQYCEVDCACEPDRLGQLLDLLHATRSRPVFQFLQCTSPTLPYSLKVRFEEKAETVAWQVEQWKGELTAAGLEPVLGPAWPMHWPAEAAPGPEAPEPPVVLKANLRPSAVADFLNQARGLPAVSRVEAVPGSGMARVIVEGAFLTAEKVRETVAPLLDRAAADQGNLIVERAPADWKADLPIWGRPRGDLAQMRAVKDQLDPRRIFNPGRYLDGL